MVAHCFICAKFTIDSTFLLIVHCSFPSSEESQWAGKKAYLGIISMLIIQCVCYRSNVNSNQSSFGLSIFLQNKKLGENIAFLTVMLGALKLPQWQQHNICCKPILFCVLNAQTMDISCSSFFSMTVRISMQTILDWHSVVPFQSIPFMCVHMPWRKWMQNMWLDMHSFSILSIWHILLYWNSDWGTNVTHCCWSKSWAF